MALGGLCLTAFAADPATQTAATTAPAATEPAKEATWPPGLLMDGLDAIGAKKPMDTLGIRTYGYVEAGFMGRLTGGQTILPGRLLDARRPNNIRLNQLSLTVDRPYDTEKQFDIGGRATALYGGDAMITHALGLNQMGSGDGENWFDPFLFYGQAWLKTGKDSGFEFTVGKFAGPLGFEATDAPSSPMYSHSYLYNNMGPFTVTGAQVKYIFNSQWSAYFAIVNGWDDFRDNNHAHSYIAGGTWNSAEQIGGHSRATVALNVMTGPETEYDVNDYRTVVDGYVTYWWSEKLSQTVHSAWGNHMVNTDKHQYGVAHYLSYIFNDYCTGTWRTEWFRDDTETLAAVAANWYEMTWGVALTPCPTDKYLKNLQFRPELRWDFADQAVFGASRDNQLTLGMDVIFKF